VSATVKALQRFTFSIFFFFLLLNILAVPILISQAPQGSIWHFSSRLVTLWNVLFIPAIIFAFLRVHLFLSQNPKPLLAQWVLLAIGSLLVYVLLVGFPFIRLPGSSSATIIHRIATPNTIFYASNKFIWIGSSQGRVQGPILIYTPRHKDPFKIYPEGVFDPELNTLHILQTGENIPLYDRISSKRPFLLATLWSDLQHFTQRLTPRHPLDGKAILSIVTFVFLLAALLSLMYLTRWLLFNSLLALSLPFISIASIAFLDALGGIPYPEYLPAVLQGGIGVFCFALQIILRPSGKR